MAGMGKHRAPGCGLALARGAVVLTALACGAVGCGPEPSVRPAPRVVHEGDGCLFLGVQVERNRVVLTCVRDPGDDVATWKRARVR